MRALNRLFGRFFRDRRGNISMIFGLTLVPLVVAVGTGVDYSLAARMKAKLQSAADAAAVGSISDNSPGYLAATQMTSDGTVTAGQTDADNVFNGIMATVTGYSGLSESSTVTKTGANLKSVVTFSAQVPTTFMKIAGFTNITVNGTSSAGGSLPLYLDFYLTLDVSGSMGLPSTTAEAARMQSINPDNIKQYPTGCTLACHFSPQNSACTDSGTQQYSTNNYCMGYAYSRVSQSALSSLINMASTKKVPKTVPGLPNSMISGLPGSLNSEPTYGMHAEATCQTDGTDA
jgi:Flp pilus assembly protein TadG